LLEPRQVPAETGAPIALGNKDWHLFDFFTSTCERVVVGGP
jgi:hypothetical protein